jgi:gamma-glutamylcyclotransferase (GGCT)/AIG2-like uncharacterized protein YtfP
MRAVTGKTFTGQKAQLGGYQIRRVKGAEYPGIVVCEEESVSGLLYTQVDEQSLRVLDAFEGEEYERRQVVVRLHGDKEVEAFAYVIRPQHRGRLSHEPWTMDQFMQSELPAFMARFVNGRRQVFDPDDGSGNA